MYEDMIPPLPATTAHSSMDMNSFFAAAVTSTNNALLSRQYERSSSSYRGQESED